MKQLLERYATYNVWANHRLIFIMESLSDTEWYKEIPSSFNSLYKTVFHIWDAESIWWQRMRLHEHIIRPSTTFDSSPKDACNGWLHQSMQWETFVKSPELTMEALESNLIYKNITGEEFFQPVSDVILHVFNHSTYHRGQLVTMLRALGVEKIPQTDFALWSRTVGA